MRRLGPFFATLAVSTSIAVASPDPESATPPAADTATTPDAHDAHDKTAFPFPMALAVNAPFMWSDARSIGVSAYVAVHAHQSIRLNVASYKYEPDPINEVLGGEIGHAGRFTDLGVAWQYWARSVWSGFSLELGVLRRAQDTHWDDDNASPEIIETKATGYAGRTLIGWSWLGWNRVFLAAAAGVSVGRYAGTEATRDFGMPMFVTHDFARMQVTVETYLRFGIAFGL